jgi:hypothetical protein
MFCQLNVSDSALFGGLFLEIIKKSKVTHVSKKRHLIVEKQYSSNWWRSRNLYNGGGNQLHMFAGLSGAVSKKNINTHLH